LGGAIHTVAARGKGGKTGEIGGSAKGGGPKSEGPRVPMNKGRGAGGKGKNASR